MKKMISVHRYLSCLIAPAMLFFALSGAWQSFRLQDTKKDGSYTAPVLLQRLSQFHKAKVSGAWGACLKVGQILLAAAFATTATTGIILAFRLTKTRVLVWSCLAMGVGIPVLICLAAKVAADKKDLLTPLAREHAAVSAGEPVIGQGSTGRDRHRLAKDDMRGFLQ